MKKEIDKLFSEKLETDCEVSMAFTGSLRISVDYGFFNIKADTKAIDWIKWSGDYETMQDYINKEKLAIEENEEKIAKLMQSYYNKPFLKESEE